MHGLENVWITAHAEIVVGAPDGDLFVAAGHVSAREFLRETIDVVEVAVGFVFVLFVEFGAIEGFVVVFFNDRCSGFGTGHGNVALQFCDRLSGL